MLTVEIKVNGKLVQRFAGMNIHPRIVSKDFKGECPYIVCDSIPKSIAAEDELGFVSHKRKDGIVKLVHKMLGKAIEKGY
jgi:hypothetical protein